MQKIPMTVQGAKKLRAELDQLKRVERHKIIEAIAEARAHGDLKENAEYHAARERQSFIEGRIQDLEAKLSRAQVIDVKQLPRDGRVVFGVTVDVVESDGETEHRFQIVGDEEADFKAGKISVSSPIARALLGTYEGEVVQVKTPSGRREFEILAVHYL